ncbi:LacI family DNA-binding transcriptional regulator [Motilibacter aurantiacus]|uniref:LacI family DNA-binding transcriptional regulator n=1 Tax=Motilibacter aurantiacus TaxID=2714955 RepID=UPI00140D5520|nr:LacI family transcriptional regulator [Motilibacter aurantiacus]
MAVTIRDVARLAGVDPGTVSRALTRPGLVNDATRLRVLQAVRDAGYVPNASARAVRRGGTGSIALVVLDIGNPFFTELTSAVESCAQESGRLVDLFSSGADARREERVLEHVLQLRPDGVVVMPLDPEHPLLHRMSATGTPVVVLGHRVRRNRLSSVRGDEGCSGREVARHLVELGHRRVLLAGPLETPRLAGARRALTAASATAELRITGRAGLQDGRAVGETVAGTPARRRPTAVFCNNDMMALGLLQFARERHIRVPEDLAVVGYDDTALASAASGVGLTSVRTPPERIGAAAVRLLSEEAAGVQARRDVVVRPRLHVRASTVGQPPVRSR